MGEIILTNLSHENKLETQFLRGKEKQLERKVPEIYCMTLCL